MPLKYYILLILILLNACGVGENVLTQRFHFKVSFGSGKAHLGILDKSKNSAFLYDQQLLTSYISCKYGTVTFLDNANFKILQFDYAGILKLDFVLNRDKNDIPQGKSQFLFVDNDSAGRVYSLEMIRIKNDTVYTVWQIDKTKKNRIVTRRVSMKKSFGLKNLRQGVSRIRNMFLLSKDQLVMVWETRFDSDVQIEWIDIVNIKNKKVKSYSIPQKSLVLKLKGKLKLMKIMSVFPSYSNKVLLFEILYVEDKVKLKKVLYKMDLIHKTKLTPVSLPTDIWYGIKGITEFGMIYFTKNVRVKKPYVYVYFDIYSPVSGDTKKVVIKADTGNGAYRNFYLSNDGRLFNFKIFQKNIHVVSWKP